MTIFQAGGGAMVFDNLLCSIFLSRALPFQWEISRSTIRFTKRLILFSTKEKPKSQSKGQETVAEGGKERGKSHSSSICFPREAPQQHPWSLQVQDHRTGAQTRRTALPLGLSSYVRGCGAKSKGKAADLQMQGWWEYF